MKRKHLIITLIAVETVMVVGLYFYGLIQSIEAKKAWHEASIIKSELQMTTQQLEKVRKELEGCSNKAR